MCSSGFSAANIQKQVQNLQGVCSVATALAKSAAKSYLSGQVLGVITELQSIKEVGDTVQIIGKVQRTRAEYEKWADGLEAAAQGRLQEAAQALSSLAPQISPDIRNTVAWVEAAQAVVTKNVDSFLGKLASVAGEIDLVMVAKEDIDKLRTVANDIGAIQAAAQQCAKVSTSITPQAFPGWKDVVSQATLETAVAAYERSFREPLIAAARCQAVYMRASRAISA
jgi:copper chaperone CopZ